MASSKNAFQAALHRQKAQMDAGQHLEAHVRADSPYALRPNPLAGAELKQVNFKLPAPMHRAMKRLCKELGITVQEYLTRGTELVQAEAEQLRAARRR